jgi:FkbM family methyltransferase
MKNNLFIDLGTHMGSGLLKFIKKYSMNEDNWIIHTFEPQPILFELASTGTKERYAGYPYSFDDMNEVLRIFPSIIRHNAAAADFDGTTKLSIEKDIKEMHQGSSIIEDVPKSNKRDFDGYFVEVKVVDIFKFIEEKITQELDNLIIKIDVEGAEFNILNNFIKNYSIGKKLKAKNIELYCEFHHRCLPNDPLKYPSVNFYVNELSKFNITLHQWD